MIKHLLNEKDKNKNVIYKGVTYRSVGREVLLPEAVERYNPVIEEKTEEKIFNSEKDELVDKAYGLGLGSPSTLKRLSIETLKERIEEAN